MVLFHMTKLEPPNCFSNIVVVNRPCEWWNVEAEADKEVLSLSPCFQLSTTGKFLQPSSLNQYAATNSSVSPGLVHALSSISKNRETQVGV